MVHAHTSFPCPTDNGHCFDMCVRKKCNWYLTSDDSFLDCSKSEFDREVLERICCSESSDWVKAWKKEHNENAFGDNGSACLIKATPPSEPGDDPDKNDPGGKETPEGSNDGTCTEDAPDDSCRPTPAPILPGGKLLKSACYHDNIENTSLFLTIEVYQLAQMMPKDVLEYINSTSLISLYMLTSLWFCLVFFCAYISVDAWM